MPRDWCSPTSAQDAGVFEGARGGVSALDDEEGKIKSAEGVDICVASIVDSSCSTVLHALLLLVLFHIAVV
jgi:hypothetical protein